MVLFENKIVWEDNQEGILQVYLYDDLTGATPIRICPSSYFEGWASVHGNKIVWEDKRDLESLSQIYLYTMPLELSYSFFRQIFNQIREVFIGLVSFFNSFIENLTEADKHEVAGDEKEADNEEGLLIVETTERSETEYDKNGGSYGEETEEQEEAEEELPELEDQEELKEAPTITLEIYEGPIYSSADNTCYYRIKANVTGKPAPDVEFSKDDSGGAWGKYKVQVNLDSPSDTYTLEATVKNSSGSQSDSITLKWGCNRSPVIADIKFHNVSGNIYTGERYEISVEASDLDGGELYYRWSVNGGKIDSPNSNPTHWVTPGSAGKYQLEVEVEDSSGGMAAMAKTVVVEQLEFGTNIDLPVASAEGGYIVYDNRVMQGGVLYTGDSVFSNAHCKGYISFDITGLAGATIDNASIYFDNKSVLGDPSFYKIFLIYSVFWGASPIELSDYNIFGDEIVSYPVSTGPDFSCGNTKLRMELQEAINLGRERFQVMIDVNSASSDGDDSWDGLEYSQSGVNLSVGYTP